MSRLSGAFQTARLCAVATLRRLVLPFPVVVVMTFFPMLVNSVAGLAAAGSWHALSGAALALLVLLASWMVRPQQSDVA